MLKKLDNKKLNEENAVHIKIQLNIMHIMRILYTKIYRISYIKFYKKFNQNFGKTKQ